MSLRLTVASSLSQRPRILSNLVVLAKFFAVCQRLSMPLVFPFHARLSRMNVLPEIALPPPTAQRSPPGQFVTHVVGGRQDFALKIN